MHLSPKFGNTYKEIEKDGFKITQKVKIPLNSDRPTDISNATARALIGISKAYKKLSPDIVVLLGDRFEMLSAAFAAAAAKIPIAHLHGGESSLGSLDEVIRHSITKMSSYHFVSTEKYRDRVIQLGEKPSSVYVVGALGVERIKKIKLFSKKDIEKKLNFTFDKNNILITYHPVTLDKHSAFKDVKEVLLALKKFKNTKKIFTMPNADVGGALINNMIKKFVKNKKNNSVFFKSLGQKMYFSVMKNSDLVLGNSSSGIIETPSLNKYSINIGDRQGGRVTAKSTITCEADQKIIIKVIKKIFFKNLKNTTKKFHNPYEKSNTSKKIYDKIKTLELKNIIKKKFYDIKK
jgi:GDP/UDP-N,N'-diacetylbacillosamine 2-epimerase (hydrolysing)